MPACGPSEHPDAEPARPKNVVLVFVDTLNRSALRAYSADAPELPELDRFARDAVVYEEAVSTASWTLHAYASLLTGLFPRRHGVVHVEQRMRDDVLALPELLQQHGYESVAFTDGGFTSMVHGFERGFDRYNAWVNPDWPGAPAVVPRGGKGEKAAGQHLFDRGIAYLRSKAGKEKDDPGFFLLLHTYSVHNYWQVQPWVLDRLSEPISKRAKYYSYCLNDVERCSEQDWETLRRLYRASVEHMDEGFGRLLQTLSDTGLGESTLVVFLSDHGEGFAPEAGRIHHAGRLHEDLVRVPLMMAGPGIEAGRIHTPTSLVDVLPTVLGFLDIPLPEGLDGIAIASEPAGDGGAATRPLFASEYQHYWRDGDRFIFTDVPQEPVALAVIQNMDWYIRSRSGEELYDMRSDSMQAHNLVELSPKTDAFRAQADWSRFQILRSPVGERSQGSTDELRALGYLN